jgi:nucleoside-diphosphate-sugar epimerase
MAETILVTGATGTVGSEIVKLLRSSAKGEREGKKEELSSKQLHVQPITAHLRNLEEYKWYS